MNERALEIGHYINGSVVEGTSGRFGQVFNPTTGLLSGQVAFASVSEVNIAIESAKNAFSAWATVSIAQRSQTLFRYRELVRENSEQLASMICAEEGKTLLEARGEVRRGIDMVEFSCGAPHFLKGEFGEGRGVGMDSYSMRQPLGVCVGITPFNFPIMVPMWMFPLAIVCGNTFVLKPSEHAPSAPLFLAELFTQAGAPKGVLNVLNGDKDTVEATLSHPDVAAVSFVGSTPVAEYVYRTAIVNNKRVQALGGAKNHVVVLPDADIEQAADAIVSGAYGSSGERCMAISVVVAVGTAGDQLIECLVPRVLALKVGSPLDTGVAMGPLITKEAQQRVESYINIGSKEGAVLLVDGRDLKPQEYTNGYFIGGSLFDMVESKMRIYKEEIFGPVLCVVRVADYQEALALVNNHELGNGAVIFTRNHRVARDFLLRVNVGMVGVNVPVPVPPAAHSFGGWKRSFFGDHSLQGMEGVRFYTHLKTITSR